MSTPKWRAYSTRKREQQELEVKADPTARGADAGEAEDEAEAEEQQPKGPGKRQPDFKKFRLREHVRFLAAPHWQTPDPEFLRQYYVLYFLLAFLVRARRNNRYARFLRLLRTERLAVAEALPGHVGLAALGAEVVNLSRAKAAALAHGRPTLEPHLTELRSAASPTTADPQVALALYRSLYQRLVVTLHSYDAARLLDQWRPGPQGLLVPIRRRTPIPRPPYFIPPREPPKPFLFKSKRVVMLDPSVDDEEDEGEGEAGAATPAGAKTRHRVLGTLPNVMPRRQLAEYYELYQTLKEEGALPPRLRDDPYRAMRGFCKHWVTWALGRQREIAAGQRLAFAGTVELAARMVRYHQGLGVSKLLGAAVGQRAGEVTQGLFQYREALLKFYDNVLVKYTGPSEDVRRLVGEIARPMPPTPMELFDSVWRSVFLSKEGIFNWRMNATRRQFLRRMAEYRADHPEKQRNAEAKRNEHRFLRHYFLVKTLLSMAVVGRPPRPHPSQPLAVLRERVLALLYELLLPAARLATHLPRRAPAVLWSAAVQERPLQFAPRPPAAPVKPRLPRGEIDTSHTLVQRFPIHNTTAPSYLRRLAAYRRNHLLRTRSLGLIFTPRGPQPPVPPAAPVPENGLPKSEAAAAQP